VILDAEGNVRWFYQGAGGGDVDATYIGQDRILFGGMGNTAYPPTIVGLDKKVTFQGTTTTASPLEIAGTWNHDAGISADGSAVFALTMTRVDDTWLGFVIKKIDLATNQVSWSWDSTEHGVATGELPEGSAAMTDPYHVNAVWDQWEDGRLYVYFNSYWLFNTFKVDYLTGEIVWKLGYQGDFELLEADGSPARADRWWFASHDAKRIGNRFVIYDNHSARPDITGNIMSRAVDLELDESTMTATLVRVYSETGWQEPIWGGYDLLPNGNGLIAMAHCFSCGSGKNSALVEIDAQAKPVWRADFRDAKEDIYRADRIDGCAIFSNTTYCPKLGKE
jgi:hypothetical protein